MLVYHNCRLCSEILLKKMCSVEARLNYLARTVNDLTASIGNSYLSVSSPTAQASLLTFTRLETMADYELLLKNLDDSEYKNNIVSEFCCHE